MKFTIRKATVERKLTSDDILAHLETPASARWLARRLGVDVVRVMRLLGKMADAGLVRSEFHQVGDGKGCPHQESIYSIIEEGEQ